jgi:hypothetical protein
MHAFYREQDTRAKNGCAALLGALNKYLAPHANLTSFSWAPRGLSGEPALDSLCSIVAASTQLEHLDVSGVRDSKSAEKIAEIAADLPHLQCLNLPFSSFEADEEAALLFADESKFTNLTSLNLACICHPTDHFLLKMSTRWPERITDLDLSSCYELTDASLTDVLRKAINLESLNLSRDTKYSQVVVQVITKSCYKLKNLTIGHPRMTGEALSELSRLTALTRLDISPWSTADPKDIFNLLFHLTKLTSLRYPALPHQYDHPVSKWKFALEHSFQSIEKSASVAI